MARSTFSLTTSVLFPSLLSCYIADVGIAQVGYHNEHHDFPSIPWTRLPALNRIAKDFYDPLPSHKSWPMVTIRFIFGQSLSRILVDSN